MSKQRTKIPTEKETHLLYLCDHTCCICRESDKGIQIHHINRDSQDNNLKNLAVLCLTCHDKAHKTGGLTRNFSPDYITKCRDEWIKTVISRREESDERHIEMKTKKDSKEHPKDKLQNMWSYRPSLTTFEIAVIKSLPKIKAELSLIERAQLSEAKTTVDSVKAVANYNESLKSILIMLADFYHPEYFKDQSPKEFFEEITSARSKFFGIVSEPYGHNSAGTMRSQIYQSLRTQDIDHLIETMVGGFTGEYDFDFKHWVNSWRNADR